MEHSILEILLLSKYTLRASLRIQLTAKGYRLTDRELRKQVEVMITESHYCIQSSSRGYSLITSEDELNKASQYFDNKIEAMEIRKNCLRRNWQEARNKQVEDNQFRLFV